MKNCQKHGRDTIEHCTPVLLHLFQYIYCFIVFQKMSLSPAVNTAENSRCYSKAVKQRYGNTQLVLLTPAHLSGNLCRVIHQAEMRQHYPFRSAGCAWRKHNTGRILRHYLSFSFVKLLLFPTREFQRKSGSLIPFIRRFLLQRNNFFQVWKGFYRNLL